MGETGTQLWVSVFVCPPPSERNSLCGTATQFHWNVNWEECILNSRRNWATTRQRVPFPVRQFHWNWHLWQDDMLPAEIDVSVPNRHVGQDHNSIGICPAREGNDAVNLPFGKSLKYFWKNILSIHGNFVSLYLRKKIEIFLTH